MEEGGCWIWVPPLPSRLRESCRLQLLELAGLNTIVYGIPQHFIKQFVTEITFVVLLAVNPPGYLRKAISVQAV